MSIFVPILLLLAMSTQAQVNCTLATSATQNSITVTYADAGANGFYYLVIYAQNDWSNLGDFTTKPSGTTSHTFTGLDANTRYVIDFTAYDSRNWSRLSNNCAFVSTS